MPFTSFIKDLGNYESRKVAKTEGPITVSTAYTSDEGYETALIDANGVHPVERYPDMDKAEEGHSRWVEFAKTGDGKSVSKLFWSDFEKDPELITLKAVKEV